MKWPLRLMLMLVVLLLVAGIAGIIFLVRARMDTNEYLFQVDAILAAARVANGGEALEDPARAVIAEYGGRRSLIVPGNYQALASYLKRDPAHPLLASIREEEALKITFCAGATLLAVPEGDSMDQVLVRLITGNRTLTMHLRGGNLWINLLACAMEGTYHDENLSLSLP